MEYLEENICQIKILDMFYEVSLQKICTYLCSLAVVKHPMTFASTLSINTKTTVIF